MHNLPTIVELETFARDVEGILSVDERGELAVFLSENPEAGVLVRGGSGVRKLRWASSGRGKRGGARVIYYYHNLDAPLFLIAIFAKNQKSDLDPDELKAARQFAETIAKEQKRKE